MSQIENENTHFDDPEITDANGNKVQRCIPIESYKLLLKEKNRLREEIETITLRVAQSSMVKDLEKRNKELENSVNTLMVSLKKLEKENKLLETVILKQEEKVARQEKAMITRKEMMKKYEEAINVLTTANEEIKHKIASLKQFYNENESKEIVSLKNKIITFENIIEIKDSKLEAMNTKYKLLQNKYLKMSSEKRLKPQEELLNQAKEMKMSRIDKDLLSNQSTRYQNINSGAVKSKTDDIMSIKNKYPCNAELPLIMQVNVNGKARMNYNNSNKDCITTKSDKGNEDSKSPRENHSNNEDDKEFNN